MIEKRLSSSTSMEVKPQPNAGRKWEYLKKRFLKSSNTRKALKLMKMANWTGDQSKNEREAYRELMQMAEEFIEMNGNDTIKVRGLVVIWYLRGLGDKYTTLRDTLMSSDTTLDEEYVLGRVEDLRQLRGEPAEKGSKVHQKKGMKCFACNGIGHIAKKCPSTQEDEDDQPGANGRGKGQKNGRYRKKPTKYKGRSAEDHEESFEEDPEEGEYGARAVSEEIVSE